MPSARPNPTDPQLPKLYKIEITNPRTKVTVTFLGQGVRLAEAVKDGLGNLGPVVRIGLPLGKTRTGLLSDFEEDAVFGEE